jgi:hypothetical protein
MIRATKDYIRLNRQWLVRIFCSSVGAFIIAQWIILLNGNNHLSLPIIIAIGIVASIMISAFLLILIVASCLFNTYLRLSAAESRLNMTIPEFIKTDNYRQNRDDILLSKLKTGWLQ